MGDMIQRVTEVNLVDGYTSLETKEFTKVIKFRPMKAGDLKVLDGKGEHEGMQAFAARVTGLTPGMVADLSIADYAVIMQAVRGFLEPLKATSVA